MPTPAAVGHDPSPPTDPACAAPKALGRITINGVKAAPSTTVDTHRGVKAGILTLTPPQPGNSGGARALLTNNDPPDEDYYVCIKLKKKGPCSTVTQLCCGEACVLTAKDKEHKCCPTSVLP